MKVWRVTLERKNGDGSGGFKYFATKREAREFSESSEEDECMIDSIHVHFSKRGLIKSLNVHGGPDNG